eukprot:TRINITY_DN66783_c0_g1_i1.p1 TRINITY_DN66783_c0_g1~~TRINITY_DN66783_c0_g1_i1.p1  ORF type:complete len:320 (+),score=103.04 TRINITY_DN66783_c0_g1_i1:84-962(+)
MLAPGLASRSPLPSAAQPLARRRAPAAYPQRHALWGARRCAVLGRIKPVPMGTVPESPEEARDRERREWVDRWLERKSITKLHDGPALNAELLEKGLRQMRRPQLSAKQQQAHDLLSSVLQTDRPQCVSPILTHSKDTYRLGRRALVGQFDAQLAWAAGHYRNGIITFPEFVLGGLLALLHRWRYPLAFAACLAVGCAAGLQSNPSFLQQEEPAGERPADAAQLGAAASAAGARALRGRAAIDAWPAAAAGLAAALATAGCGILFGAWGGVLATVLAVTLLCAASTGQAPLA